MSPLGATDGPLLHDKARAEGSGSFDEQLRQAERRRLEEAVARAEAVGELVGRWTPRVISAGLVLAGVGIGWALRGWLR